MSIANDHHAARGDGAVHRLFAKRSLCASRCCREGRGPSGTGPGRGGSKDLADRGGKVMLPTAAAAVPGQGRVAEEDLTLAARNAVIRMIELLEERGWSREQAYVLCSVAVDLRVSNVVDVPNVTVSALLPEDIFGH